MSEKITEKIYCSIDWLEYTVAWPNHVTEWPILTTQEEAIFKTCFPFRPNNTGHEMEREKGDPTAKMHGYSKVRDYGYCSVNVNPNLRSQKIGVRYNGDGLRYWRSLGESTDELFAFVKSSGATATRIDIAFDLIDYGILPAKVYEHWKAGKLRTTARTAIPLTKGQWINGVLTEATTLYIGSRESEVMIRLYEKGKQMGTSDDWVRLEIEIKGDKAKSIVPEIVRIGQAKVGQQILRDFILTADRYKFLRDLLDSEDFELPKVERGETDTDAWLRNVVMPIIERRMQLELETPTAYCIQRDMEALISKSWQRRAEVIKAQYGVHRAKR